MLEEESSEQSGLHPTDKQDYFTTFIKANQTYPWLIARFLYPKDILQLASTCKTTQQAFEGLVTSSNPLKSLFQGTCSLADSFLLEETTNNYQSAESLVSDYLHKILTSLEIEVAIDKFQSYLDNYFTQQEVILFFDYLAPNTLQEVSSLFKTTSLALFKNQPLINAFINYLIQYSICLKQNKLFYEDKKPKLYSLQFTEFYKLCHHLESILVTLSLCYYIHENQITNESIPDNIVNLLINCGWHTSLNGHCLVLLDVKLSNMTITQNSYFEHLLSMTIDLQIKQRTNLLSLEEKKRLKSLHLFFQHFSRIDLINLVNNRYKNGHFKLIESLLCINGIKFPRQVFVIWVSKNVDTFFKAIEYDELKILTDSELFDILTANNFDMLERALYLLRLEQQNKPYLVARFCYRLNAPLVYKIFSLLLEKIEKNLGSTKDYYLFHFFAEFALSNTIVLNKLSDEQIKEMFQSSHQHWFAIPRNHPSWNPYWINTSSDNDSPKEKRLFPRLLSHSDFRTRLCQNQSKLTYDLALTSKPATENLALPAQKPLLNNLNSKEIKTIGNTHQNKKFLSLAEEKSQQEQKQEDESDNNALSGKKIAAIVVLTLIAGGGIVLSLTGIGAIAGVPIAVKSTVTIAATIGIGVKTTTIISITTGAATTLISTAVAVFTQIKRPFVRLKNGIKNLLGFSPKEPPSPNNESNDDSPQPQYNEHLTQAPSVRSQSTMTYNNISPPTPVTNSQPLFIGNPAPLPVIQNNLEDENTQEKNHPTTPTHSYCG